MFTKYIYKINYYLIIICISNSTIIYSICCNKFKSIDIVIEILNGKNFA